MKLAAEQPKKTYVTFILDESASMSSVRDATISGFNEQLKAVKLMESEDHEVYLSLVVFSTPGEGIRLVRNRVKVSSIDPLKPEEYLANGFSTALLDAMDFAINHTREAQDLNEEGNAALVVTMTDGQNNSSVKVLTRDAIKEQISSLTSRGNWTFTYMGIGDLNDISKGFGIPTANTAAFASGAKGMRVNSTRNTAGLYGYAAARTAGQTEVSSFYAAKEDESDTPKVVTTSLSTGIDTVATK